MTEPTDKNPVCPECKKRAPSVSRVTLYHLLEPAASRTIDNEKRFRICRTRSCSVLYFSSDHDQSWDVSDARTTIGFKQPPDKPPHTVCYCFGYTAENIENEIRETG